MSNINK